jgi:hypothetical protein
LDIKVAKLGDTSDPPARMQVTSTTENERGTNIQIPPALDAKSTKYSACSKNRLISTLSRMLKTRAGIENEPIIVHDT